VTREIRVRPDDVYRLIRRGELPAVKLDGKGRWRIERSTLDAHRRK
jgi:excisionase family DNA binding protein